MQEYTLKGLWFMKEFTGMDSENPINHGCCTGARDSKLVITNCF